MENKLSNENNQLSSEHILGLLPHRYPFALVDKVIENIPGERAVAVKNVTINIYFVILVNMVIVLYVLFIVNVNRNILNVNGSKCKCTCNIVIFKELTW